MGSVTELTVTIGILPQIVFGIRQANRCHGNLVPDVYYQHIKRKSYIFGYPKVLRQVSLTIQISLSSAVSGFYMKDGYYFCHIQKTGFHVTF